VYEGLRREGGSRVQKQARMAGQIYRAGDEISAETTRQIAGLSDDYWLTDYDAEREAMRVLQTHWRCDPRDR